MVLCSVSYINLNNSVFIKIPIKLNHWLLSIWTWKILCQKHKIDNKLVLLLLLLVLFSGTSCNLNQAVFSEFPNWSKRTKVHHHNHNQYSHNKAWALTKQRESSFLLEMHHSKSVWDGLGWFARLIATQQMIERKWARSAESMILRTVIAIWSSSSCQYASDVNRRDRSYYTSNGSEREELHTLLWQWSGRYFGFEV